MIDPNQFLVSQTKKLLTIPGIKFMHSALFFAVFIEWQNQKYPEWIHTNRRRLLALSCIHSPISYHRSIKMLIKNKIIEYRPSYHPQEGSKIKFIMTTELDEYSLLLP